MAKKKFTPRMCLSCGELKTASDYLPTSSPFFVDGFLTVCTDCVINMFNDADDWNALDRLCQWADWPFKPDDWTRLAENQGVAAIKVYAAMFKAQDYQGAIDWKEQNEIWKDLQERKMLHQCQSEVEAEHLQLMTKKWQGPYVEEELEYLENMLNSMLSTFAVAPGLQMDQVYKLCKISLLIDKRIREGEKFDDLMKGYDGIIDVGGFSSKNAMNANDFESVGELFGFLEKRGFMNRFYDNVQRDIVDETIANINANTRRIVLGEVNIQDQAQEKLKAYNMAKVMEQKLDSDADVYDDDAYTLRALERLGEEEGSIDEIEYIEPEEEFVAEVE